MRIAKSLTCAGIVVLFAASLLSAKQPEQIEKSVWRDKRIDIKKIAEQASKAVLELSKKFNIKLDYLNDNDMVESA